jgi:hypothetical protein
MLSTDEIFARYPAPTQTGLGCRNALEIVEHILIDFKSGGPYSYCETGSYFGGTLSPRINSAACGEILSVDKRVGGTPDERRPQGYDYQPISSEQMLAELSKYSSSEAMKKMRLFDGTLQEYLQNPGASAAGGEVFDWVFIDAEHTNIACFQDCLSAMKLISPAGVISLHDSWMTYSGIANFHAFLVDQGIPFQFAHIDGDVTSFFLGDVGKFVTDAGDRFSRYFVTMSLDEFLSASKEKLWTFQINEILNHHDPVSMAKALYRRAKFNMLPWTKPVSNVLK